jgi:hypothetical protein
MGSVSGMIGANRDRYSENTWGSGTENTTGSQAGKRRAVFGPEAQQTLSYLGTPNSGESPYTGDIANTYRGMTQDKGEMNPYVDEIIGAENELAKREFAGGLAQTRAGAYRGGTGNNLYQQGKLASEFSTKLARDNANLRYGAFNDAQNRGFQSQVAGATGLAGLRESDINQDLGQRGLATQLLALLRGEDTDMDMNQVVQAARTGGTSGKKSGTMGNVSGTYGGMGGM